MPPIPPPDIVATRHDHFGRSAVFHQPGPSLIAPLPWRAVALDQGEQTVIIQVRLDEHDEPGAAAWTACDLLRVALARQATEADRSGDVMAQWSGSNLAHALVALQRRPGLPLAPAIALTPGLQPSAYPWTVASLPGVGSLQLCPGQCGDGEGVTPELLLHVLDQLLGDAIRGIRTDRHLRTAAQLVGVALREETDRVRGRRGPGRSE